MPEGNGMGRIRNMLFLHGLNRYQEELADGEPRRGDCLVNLSARFLPG